MILTGCESKTGTVIGKTVLSENTTWSGTVIVKGDVLVPEGITLTVLPGTQVKFERIEETSDQNLFGKDAPWYPTAELIVRGRIVAQGTPDRHIVFTSNMRDARPADWGAINLLGGRDSILQYCRIFCAYNGLHAHSATAIVTNCEFARNGVAISFKREDAEEYKGEAHLTILNNDIHHNKGGISLKDASAVISFNDIHDNAFFGIWVKEQAEAQVLYNNITDNDKGLYFYDALPTAVRFNNISGNKEYNVALAESQPVSIQAADNFWGLVDPKRIGELIFDRAEDPGVAAVIVEPILRRKVDGAGLKGR